MLHLQQHADSGISLCGSGDLPPPGIAANVTGISTSTLGASKTLSLPDFLRSFWAQRESRSGDILYFPSTPASFWSQLGSGGVCGALDSRVGTVVTLQAPPALERP